MKSKFTSVAWFVWPRKRDFERFDTPSETGGARFRWNQERCKGHNNDEAFACFSFIGPKKRFLFPRLSHV